MVCVKAAGNSILQTANFKAKKCRSRFSDSFPNSLFIAVAVSEWDDIEAFMSQVHKFQHVGAQVPAQEFQPLASQNTVRDVSRHRPQPRHVVFKHVRISLKHRHQKTQHAGLKHLNNVLNARADLSPSASSW